MNKVSVAALAIAGSIGLVGCQSTGGTSVDVTQVVQIAQADFQNACAVFAGAIPTADSIIAIISAADPAILVAGNAVMTGFNIAVAICNAEKAVATKTSRASTAPVIVDGVVVYFHNVK